MSPRRSEREALTKAVHFLAGLLARDEGNASLAASAARAGFPPTLLARLTALFREPGIPRLPAPLETRFGLPEQARLGELLRALEAFFLHQLDPGPREDDPALIHALADELAGCRPEEARILIAKGRDYGRSEICLRLCELSQEAAEGSPERARELARLALEVAGRVENEDPTWRGRLRARATACLGGEG